jgi:UDP-N-acetyl-D-mannosaminuronate dehydrogenase
MAGMADLKTVKIGIIGLGYVGLPLAVEFGKQYPTIGLDIKQDRVDELLEGVDSTLEVSETEIADAKLLTFTSRPDDLADCNVYIVTVPTPIDKHNRPDLSYLQNSSKMVGAMLKTGDVVIYESTVFPGATEEFLCGLQSGTDKSRRQGTPRQQYTQGDLRVDPGNGGLRRCPLSQHHYSRNAPRQQPEGGRGVENYREHPA